MARLQRRLVESMCANHKNADAVKIRMEHQQQPLTKIYPAIHLENHARQRMSLKMRSRKTLGGTMLPGGNGLVGDLNLDGPRVAHSSFWVDEGESYLGVLAMHRDGGTMGCGETQSARVCLENDYTTPRTV